MPQLYNIVGKTTDELGAGAGFKRARTGLFTVNSG